jgi:hypothetical protein
MSEDLTPEQSAIELDSLRIDINRKLTEEISRLIFQYKALFRDPPLGVAISAYDHLSLSLTFAHTGVRVGHFDSRAPLKLDGVSILPKLAGPPELIANYDHLSHIAYLRQKDDKKLWPLLLGA